MISIEFTDRELEIVRDILARAFVKLCEKGIPVRDIDDEVIPFDEIESLVKKLCSLCPMEVN